jgi:hypothetical protein
MYFLVSILKINRFVFVTETERSSWRMNWVYTYHFSYHRVWKAVLWPRRLVSGLTGSSLGYSIWALWWTKWYRHFGFPLSVLFHQWSVLNVVFKITAWKTRITFSVVCSSSVLAVSPLCFLSSCLSKHLYRIRDATLGLYLLSADKHRNKKGC